MTDTQFIAVEKPSTQSVIDNLSPADLAELGTIVNEVNFEDDDELEGDHNDDDFEALIDEDGNSYHDFKICLTKEQRERLIRLCEDQDITDNQWAANCLGSALEARIGRAHITAPTILSNQNVGGTITAPSGQNLVHRAKG